MARNDKMDVFLVTAGNCGACTGIKGSGLYARIQQYVLSKGGRVHEVFTKVMRDQFSSAGDENFVRMDGVANKLFRNWFPTFVAMSRGVFDAIENGTLSSTADIANSINVYNGVYNSSRDTFDMINPRGNISADLFNQWYDGVSATAPPLPPAPASVPRPSIRPPILQDAQPQLPVLQSPNVVRIPPGQPMPGDVGDTDLGFASCPSKFDFYLSGRHSR
jgi:hypothetical protein